MTTDLGTSLVAACRRHVRGCDLTRTDVHLSGTPRDLHVVGLERDGGHAFRTLQILTHVKGTLTV